MLVMMTMMMMMMEIQGALTTTTMRTKTMTTTKSTKTLAQRCVLGLHLKLFEPNQPKLDGDKKTTVRLVADKMVAPLAMIEEPQKIEYLDTIYRQEGSFTCDIWCG